MAFGFLKKIFRRKKDVPIDELPLAQEEQPNEFSEIQSTPQFEGSSDKNELILSKLETISSKLDNLDQRLRKIEELAKEETKTW